MKALKFISTVSLLFCSQLFFAQTETTTTTTTSDAVDFKRVEIGARFMPTFTSFNVQSYNGVVQGQFAFGYGFGGLVGINFTNNVGVQGEFIYSSLSQKYRDNNNVDRRITLNYVNIPLLLSLNTGKNNPVNLNVVGGPQIGINVGSSVQSSGSKGVDTIQAVLAVKQGDLGVAYGAGLEFGLGPNRNAHIDLGFRGVFGLIDISDKSQSITTNQYYILDRAHVKTYSGYIGLTFAF